MMQLQLPVSVAILIENVAPFPMESRLENDNRFFFTRKITAFGSIRLMVVFSGRKRAFFTFCFKSVRGDLKQEINVLIRK